MTWVDGSRRAFDATDAQQTARPKLTLELVDNGDGTFSYASHVYVKNTLTVGGTVDVTLGGVDADADTLQNDSAVQVVKLRLGRAGVDDGLVSEDTPVPTQDDRVVSLLMENNELLRALLEEITG